MSKPTHIYRPGPSNSILDVAGLSVGQAHDETAISGTTIILSDRRIAAAADIRGGGPGTRETDALQPETLLSGADAIVLSGGSALGLGASDAIATSLSEQGRGLVVNPGLPPVPIVPSAILFDLGTHSKEALKGGELHRKLAREALAQAQSADQGELALGSVGAGRGATAGPIKGGAGSASLLLEDDVVVAAYVAANPFGEVVMPDRKSFWAWPYEIDGEFGGVRPDAENQPAAIAPFPPNLPDMSGELPVQAGNTTIGVIAVNADLTPAECKRVGIMAQDGYARAIRPVHTPFDGDSIFVLATGRTAGPECLEPVEGTVALPDDARRAFWIAKIGAAAGDVMARAVARGVYEATSREDEKPSWRDLQAGKRSLA